MLAPADRLRTRADLRAWVLADVRRHDVRGWASLAGALARLPQLRWQLRLRLVELVCNAPATAALGPLAPVLRGLLRWRLQAGAVRLGSTIPVNVAGPGLKLPHWGTVVVSGDAVVGPGCTLHPGTVLGVRHGLAPRLAADVYVGPGVKVFGGITVGAGAVLAANAVVNRDVDPGAVMAGVPARPVSP